MAGAGSGKMNVLINRIINISTKSGDGLDNPYAAFDWATEDDLLFLTEYLTDLAGELAPA